MPSEMNEPLLSVRDLQVHFSLRAGLLRNRIIGQLRAVDGVSFDIERGETLGLVGESGCGKSSLGRAIMELQPIDGGRIVFDGVDISGRTTSPAARRRIQMIFQDPFGSLNPRMTIGDTTAEPMLVHKLATRQNVKERVADLLTLVGLNPNMHSRYPHEFSGGQRQRIGIARALAAEPDFIVCDEPVSALDVSIQAQIVNLLEDLRERLGLTYLFIAHDLAVVRHISDRVAVMYLGKIVEIAPKAALYDDPRHPYTEALLSAVPIPGRVAEMKRERRLLEGEVPSPLNPPTGCSLHPRCRYASDICREVEPPLRRVAEKHWTACHLHPGIEEQPVLTGPISEDQTIFIQIPGEKL